MRQTPVSDYLEEISTELPIELYGNLSDAIYETVCEFDEEVAQLKAKNAKLRKQGARLFDKTLELGTENDGLRELVRDMWRDGMCECDERGACGQCEYHFPDRMRELRVEVDG